MSVTLAARRVRAELDSGSFDNFKDRLTGGTIQIWKGTALRIECGTFFALAGGAPTDAKIVDLSASNFASVTCEVKDTAASTSNLMANTVASWDFTSLTAATWLDYTAQHFVFEFTGAETNISTGVKHVVIYAITGDGAKITLGISKLEVKEDGASEEVGTPAENPGDGISLAQADARYARVDESGNVLVGTHLRFVPHGAGCYVQTSLDGITWTTQQSWP